MTNPTSKRRFLDEMLSGDLNRLRFITRFSTALVAHRENVAEHSFYVVLYSYLIALQLPSDIQINYASLLERALIHDLEEARTGDIYRPYKVSSPELKNLLHETARGEFETMMAPLVDSLKAPQITYLWDTARNPSTYEGAIVAFADYLGVLAHMLQELRVANMTMRDHYASMVEYIEEFSGEEYDFLRPFIDEARHMVQELLGAKLDMLNDVPMEIG